MLNFKNKINYNMNKVVKKNSLKEIKTMMNSLRVKNKMMNLLKEMLLMMMILLKEVMKNFRLELIKVTKIANKNKKVIYTLLKCKINKKMNLKRMILQRLNKQRFKQKKIVQIK